MFEMMRGPNGEVVLVGRLDAACAERAEEQFDALDAGTTVDMSGLEYISSLGLGLLLKTQKRLRQANAGDLRIVRAGKHVRDIFRYAGLQQIFHMDADS